jgi:hypothetical protein
MARKKTHKDEKEVIRRTLVVVALVLFIYATSVDTPGALARTAGSMVGSAVVGMTAGVEPNPYNSAATQLAQKQAELDAREANLNASGDASLTGTRGLAAASFVTSVIVLLLVTANYYMDFRRARKFA